MSKGNSTYHSIPEAQFGAKVVIAKPLKLPISKKARRFRNWLAPLYRDVYLDGNDFRDVFDYVDLLLFFRIIQFSQQRALFSQSLQSQSYN